MKGIGIFFQDLLYSWWEQETIKLLFNASYMINVSLPTFCMSENQGWAKNLVAWGKTDIWRGNGLAYLLFTWEDGKPFMYHTMEFTIISGNNFVKL